MSFSAARRDKGKRRKRKRKFSVGVIGVGEDEGTCYEIVNGKEVEVPCEENVVIPAPKPPKPFLSMFHRHKGKKGGGREKKKQPQKRQEKAPSTPKKQQQKPSRPSKGAGTGTPSQGGSGRSKGNEGPSSRGEVELWEKYACKKPGVIGPEVCSKFPGWDQYKRDLAKIKWEKWYPKWLKQPERVVSSWDHIVYYKDTMKIGEKTTIRLWNYGDYRILKNGPEKNPAFKAAWVDNAYVEYKWIGPGKWRIGGAYDVEPLGWRVNFPSIGNCVFTEKLYLDGKLLKTWKGRATPDGKIPPVYADVSVKEGKHRITLELETDKTCGNKKFRVSKEYEFYDFANPYSKPIMEMFT